MRAGRLGGLVVAAVLLVTGVGCGTDASHRDPQTVIAGRACQVLGFDHVEQTLGVHFDVAGSARTDQTDTCVLGRSGQSLPDLTLAASPTQADELIFRAILMPSSATELPGLGRSAYQMVSPASSTAGPVVEIGWLSQAPKLLVLRFTFAAGAADAEVPALQANLLSLAQAIDESVVNPTMPTPI